MQHFTCYLRFVHKYYIYRKEIVHIAKIKKYQKNFDGKLAFFRLGSQSIFMFTFLWESSTIKGKGLDDDKEQI